MKTLTRKEQLYNRMREFEERFFPESIRKRLSETDSGIRSLEETVGKKSLSKIRRRLIYKQTRSA
jgi:hypothetical protein